MKKDKWHVLPNNDEREHDESEYCWCHPKSQRQPNGNWVIVHNAMDGRELIEQGKQPN